MSRPMQKLPVFLDCWPYYILIYRVPKGIPINNLTGLARHMESIMPFRVALRGHLCLFASG